MDAMRRYGDALCAYREIETIQADDRALSDLLSRAITARYTGRSVYTGAHIRPGDRIVPVGTGWALVTEVE